MEKSTCGSFKVGSKSSIEVAASLSTIEECGQSFVTTKMQLICDAITLIWRPVDYLAETMG